MKQNIQQTAVQRAMQPVARQIKTGLEQWDIYDTDDAIQQQADDNAAELEDLQLRKKREEKEFLDVFTNELSNPTEINNTMASSSKSNLRGNLRGTSSASAAAASQEDDFTSILSQGEEDEDIQPKVSQLIQNIEIDKLEKWHTNIYNTFQ